MLHACFYTICLLFRYTSWHFYAFSRTNLLTRCHSASSLFFYCFCVSEMLHKKYSWNWTKQKPDIQIFHGASRRPKRRRSRARGRPHHQGVWPSPGPCRPVVWALWSSSDAAPSPIKTPRREKPKYPITSPEHIAIRRRCWPEDREGPEALPGTLPERGIITGGLLHCHACLWRDKWVLYLGLWVHSSS
jgi:hypothetical protein